MGNEDHLHEVSPEELPIPEEPMTLERVLDRVREEKGNISAAIKEMEKRLRELKQTYQGVTASEKIIVDLSIQSVESAETIPALSAINFILDSANKDLLEEKTENMRVLEALLTKPAWKSLCQQFPRVGDILVCEIRDFTGRLRGFGDSSAERFVMGVARGLGVWLPANPTQAQVAKAALEQVRASAES